ncbi:senescence-associated protein AAF, chlorolplastic isoform X4 [Magnolia sinica]|uniref:senescence-associated protein AAF, chlorolplastic isoform X4 n=1 Tax=Magnolia sinica TaxID=86752 RepID=UPI00265987A7|nr:senescence-associated protein AAF, chlorolplastic isoform X4 [Magnolia sinica]
MVPTTSKVSGGRFATDRANFIEPVGSIYSFNKSQHVGLHSTNQRVEFRKQKIGHLLGSKLSFTEGSWRVYGKPYNYVISKEHAVLCLSTGTHNGETKECVRHSQDCSDTSRDQIGDGEVGELFESILSDHPVMPERTTYPSRGLAEACKFVHNDAKFVNERARNDIVLLSRGITRLNDRARQDVAILGLEFLKLDERCWAARAREDTEKIDHGVKKKAARLHDIAMILKDKAQSKLKRVADQHWSDGALEADLRRANFLMRRRAMEDAFMALEDAYWGMASALSEADGIDYTDPEELELLVATLIDLDAMDGKSSVSLLAECSSSPDDSTRQALANALAAAPSMWTLGNAGMGALQRLAEDSNPAVAAAASKAIDELKRQWEIEEGDSWRFTMNNPIPADETGDDNADDEIDNPSI